MCPQAVFKFGCCCTRLVLVDSFLVGGGVIFGHFFPGGILHIGVGIFVFHTAFLDRVV